MYKPFNYKGKNRKSRIRNNKISKDKTIRIVFKYEEEYNSAIDFIKKHNCDIIDENYSENIYEEVI